MGSSLQAKEFFIWLIIKGSPEVFDPLVGIFKGRSPLNGEEDKITPLLIPYILTMFFVITA